MVIDFKFIWRKTIETPQIPENMVQYVYSGIITDKRIPEVKFLLDKEENLDTSIKDEALRFSDENIAGVTWNLQTTLSKIVRNIVESEKLGKYFILACRGGEITQAERSCGVEKIRASLRTSQIGFLINLKKN